MSTRKLLTAIRAGMLALFTRRNKKIIWSGGRRALSASMYWITAIFALVYGLQAQAQRQEGQSSQPSAAFIQAVADCAATQGISTWPGSGRWADPAFPGHGWELTWYTPEEAFSLGMTARLRLHFYTFTAYTGGQNPGDPVVGYPVWYYADLLPDVNGQTGLVYAGGPMYKVTRDQNGAETQTQVATVFVGQDNPATTGGIARSRATVVVNGFSDPDAPSNSGSRTLCLQKLGATATSGAYGTGQEGTWRSGGSFQSPSFQGINLWSEPVSNQYNGTLLTFNSLGKPIWLAHNSTIGTSLNMASGQYSFWYLRGRPMFLGGAEDPCPTDGTICFTLGHTTSVNLSVQEPGERTATIIPSINIPGAPNPDADPATCTGFSSSYATSPVPLYTCRPSAPVTWSGGPQPIWQNTKLADLPPFTPCVVGAGANSCQQTIEYAMRKGVSERFLLLVNQLNGQIAAATPALSDNGRFTAGSATFTVNAGARLKAVLVTGPPSAAVVGQPISGLRVFKSSPEFTIAFPPLSVPVITAQLQSGSTTTVGLSWGAVVGANTYYWRRVATATGIVGADTGVTSTTATDVPGDGIFRYEVKACNANSCSAYGQSANVTVGAIALDEWSTLSPNLPVAPIQDVPVPAFADGNLEVGSASGSFRVDESGQTSYQMPIATAPATGGMAPEMSINYSSGSQDGYLGVGFQISGLSAITRCRKTVETDALTSPIGVVVDYLDDAFCLDGQRLILERSGSDSFGSYNEYSTEIQSFARVRSYQQAGINGPAFWASYGKDGVLSFYGLSGTPGIPCQKLCDGRIYRNKNGSVEYTYITAWLISKVRARNSLQTTMEFEYSISQENGEARISKVWYSGADTQQGSLSAYLAFNYNAPADVGRSNPRVQFASGARATTSGYLSDIGSYNDSGVKVRIYSFSYKSRNSTGQASNPFARLESIQECAGNATSCLAPVMFTWAENLPKVNGEPAQSGQNFDDAADYKYGDINGDGRTDMVFAINDSSNNQKITLGLSTLVNGQVQLARYNTNRKLLRKFDNDRGWLLFDYNQDGRDDLLIAEAQAGTPGQWNIYLSEGSNFRSTPVQLAAPISVPYGNTDWTTDSQIADFTGDGLPDFVSPEFSNNGAVTYRLYAMRRATTARSCQTQDVVAGQLVEVAQNCPYEFAPAIPITRPASVIGGQFFKNDTESYEAVDVNGDGAADMLMRFLASCSLPPQRSATEAQAPMNFIADPAQRPVVATTGKEKAPSSDCWYWGVFENKGISNNALTMDLKKFWRTQNGSDPADSPGALQLTDLNADGLADVIYRIKDGVKEWYFELNTGTGFAPSQCMYTNSFGCSGVDNSADTGRVMDFDGDGDQDFWVGLESGSTQTNCPGGSDGEQPYAVLRFDGDRFESTFLCPNLVGHKRYRDNSLHYSADIDGDGSIDSIDMSPTGAGNYVVSRRANTFAPVDKVIEIKNGLGSTTLISYAPMNFSSVYRRDYNAATLLQGSSPVFDLLAPQYVVQRVQSSAPTPSNSGSLSSVRYFYAGSKTQGGGRGSLGMRFVGSVDEQTNVQTWTEYAQNFPFIGRPVKTLSKRLDLIPNDSCASGPGAAQCIARATVCVSAANTPDRSLVCDPFSARLGQNLSESFQSYIHNDIAWGERPQTQVYRVFPYIKLETTYEWNSLIGNSTAVKLSRVREQYSWDGNLYESEATVSALNGSTTFEKENVTSRMLYTTLPSLTSDWTTGLLNRSEVTTSRDGRSNSRYASFGYFPDGSVKTEESGPMDAPADKVLRTHYVRNAASQVILKATCSTHFSYEQCVANNGGIPTFVERVQADQQRIRRAESYVYDSAFRFVEQTYNGFNDGSNYLNYRVSSEVLARDALGNATQSRNVNGVISNSAYSPLGKLYFATTRNSGSAVTTQTRWCAGSYGASFGASPVASCPSGAQFVERSDARGGNSSWKYFDLLGREMLTAQYGFIAAGETAATLNTRIIHVSKTYDNLGRVVEVSEPYFASLGSFRSCGIGASGVPCTKTDFDFAGRSLMVTLPDGTFTTTNYETVPQCESTGGSCLKRTVINAKLQQTVEERNVLGELLRSTDAQGLSIRHSYDVYGNLVRSARTPGNGDGAGVEIANSAVYDTLSRRVSMTDPDTGITTSTYNAIGEVLTSIDANGFCIKSTYDALGRVVSRSDHREATCSGAVESTATFVFDVAANGFGMLAQESSVSGSSNTTRSQQYDSLSRIVRLNTNIDGQSFAQESTYDQYGRKFQDFDLVFDAGTPDAISASQARRLGAEYDYNGQGYQYRIRNAAGAATDIFYEVLKINARGQVERSKRGDRTSMITNVEWDPTMGRLNAIASGSNTNGSNDGALQNLRYDDASGTGYDEIGNLNYRLDARRNLRESFGYDNMNRLTASSLMRNGQTTGAQSFTYDVLGNFLFKANERQRTGGYIAVSGVAALSNSCARQSVGPHMLTGLFKNGAQDSVFCYDASGNQISAAGSTTRGISYSVHNKPLEISVTGPASSHTRYRYGPNREIVTRVDGINVTSLTTIVRYVGGVEVYQRPNQGSETNRREYKRNLAGFLIINLRAYTPSGQSTIVRSSDRRFVFKEKLGSTDVITDALGSVVAGGTMSFDAWGERRSDSDWSSLSRGQIAGFNSDQTRKGYTGHEMVDGAGLIHMGGRLYDAHTGRFLSADPLIQAPNNTQSFNRYSYVMNNPMNYTDPTGYSWLSDNWRTVASIAITVFAPYAWGVVGTGMTMTQAVITGMVSGAVQSGTLKGALMGGFSAGMFHGIGDAFQSAADASKSGAGSILAKGGELTKTGVAAKIGAHAIAGGVMSTLQGGKFGHGFISAGVVEAIGPKALAMAGKNEAAQIVAAAVVGGTASRLAGGKFANGAVTGAFQWAFNEMAAHGRPPVDSSLAGEPGYQSDYVEPPESSMFASGMEGFDAGRASEYKDAHVYLPFGEGLCASYTAAAIRAGGVSMGSTNYAKDFGPILIRAGFHTVDLANYVPQVGDVAVMDTFPGQSDRRGNALPAGHMQMYTGSVSNNQSGWVSDFPQRTFYPGDQFRVAKPAFEVYRYETVY